MTLTREQAMLRASDLPSSKGAIKSLTSARGGWSIELDTNTGFSLSRDRLNGHKPPALGDEVALYTVRVSLIRGIDLRGEALFYMTQAELDADHEKWRLEYKEEKRKRFAKDRRRLDRQFAALPSVFQRRISWFRAWNPDFRVDREGYEMMVCVDAVKIAETMKTAKGVERFRKMSHTRQRETVEFSDQHSGNSFGMAVRLAWLYLTDPLLVIAEHGALVPLTGCEEYGCAHPRPADVEAAAAKSGD